MVLFARPLIGCLKVTCRWVAGALSRPCLNGLQMVNFFLPGDSEGWYYYNSVHRRLETHSQSATM